MDQLAAIAGAAGGSRIRPALVQCVLRMLRGAAPQKPSTHLGSAALPDLVRLEPGFFSDVIRSPRRTATRLAIADHRDPYFGGVSASQPTWRRCKPTRSGVVIMV